jgi:TPR repeat protein
MNDLQDPAHIAEMATRLKRLEQLALASSEPSRAWWREDPSSLQAGSLQSSHQDERPDGAGGAAIRRARSNQPGINPWLFVMATALNTMVAAVLAVIITLGVVRQARTDGEAREGASAAGYTRSASGGAPALLAAASQPIELRPIGTPDRPLRFEAGKPAPLPLRIQPENAASEPFIMVLSGVPVGIRLSGAARIGSDTWFLPPGSANQIEIAFPEWSTTVLEVAIALRRTNGLVAAQTKAWIAVPPPAMPEAVAGTTNDETAVNELLTRADQLLDKGDIVAARALYQRAADLGSGSAALTLGSTYDPYRLWSLGALGMVGNKERAKQWYSRASELGNPDAKNRLKMLAN